MVTLVRFALGLMLVLTALFLILLVLIQRGRGGGLTGALGGAGGQSAFGTKAGDVFTRITVVVAAFWIGLCILALNLLGQGRSPIDSSLGRNAPTAIAPQTQPAGAPPAAGGPAAPATPPADGLELPPSDGAGKPAAPPPAPAPEAPPSPPSAPAPSDATK